MKEIRATEIGLLTETGAVEYAELVIYSPDCQCELRLSRLCDTHKSSRKETLKEYLHTFANYMRQQIANLE